MTISSLLRALSLVGLATVALSACDGNRDAAGTSDSSAIVQSGPNDTMKIDPSTVHIDTTDGTLQMTGTGKHQGTWAFQDVTGVLEERASAGKSQWILSLEAHDGTAARHFRFRLLRDNVQIEPGRYTFSDKNRMLDAKFEQGTEVFRSLEGATGWVELASLQGNQARGSFEMTLPALSKDDSTSTVTLKGTFDQRVQR